MALYRSATSARKLKWKQIGVKRSTKWRQLKFHKDGPCYHCGIDYTPLWRKGPPEKPVLCNACGSRWKLRGSLVNYTPKHAILVGDDYPRMSRTMPMAMVNDYRKIVLAVAAPSASYGQGTDIGKTGSGSTSSEDSVQHMRDPSGEKEPAFMEPRFVPRRKRSELIQQVLTPMERLNKKLKELMNEDPHEVPEENEGESGVLIYVDTPNLMLTPEESPLGAMLLKPITSTDESL